MTENYEPVSPSGSDLASRDEPTTLESAKHEAAELKDTAVGQAKDVAGTVKDEASAVLGEVTYQAKDFYAQTQQELKEQANTQQQRVAAGLHSVSSELDSMSANAENPGLATDVVRQLSGRLAVAASWLGDRDAGSVLTEVKRYARRKPGTFIVAAAIAGVVVGRLTRALAANASAANASAADGTAHQTSAPASGAYSPAAVSTPSTPGFDVVADRHVDTPVFAQATATHGDAFPEGDRDDRSDSV